MIAINENKNGAKYLAVIAAMAMVVCAFALVMPAEETDAASNDILYIGGTVDVPTPYETNNTVVVDKDLTIVSGGNITIGSGTNFTVNDGVKITVNEGGELIIKDGATVTVNGDLTVNRGGSLVNDATCVNNDTTKQGFTVNGALTVAKNGSINCATPAEGEPAGGQIILGNESVFEVQSSGKNHGTVQYQDIVVTPGASVSINGDVNEITIAAFSTDAEFMSSAYITGTIPTQGTITSDFNKIKVTASVVDMGIYTGVDGKATQKNVKSAVIDISGTIIAGTNVKVKVADSDGGCYQDEGMTIPALGTVSIADKLTVDEGATFDSDCDLSVPGTLTVNGTFNMAGAADITGTVTLRGNSTVSGVVDVSGTLDIVPVSKKVGEDTVTYTFTGTGAYLNIVGAGTVKVANYDDQFTGFNAAYYIDDDGAACFSSFTAALAVAAEADLEVIVGGYAAVTGVAPEAIYQISENITLSGIDVIVVYKVQINEGYTLTINEDAGMDAPEGGLVIVKGTLVDYADTSFYEDKSVETVPESDLGINAEVQSTDEDETYYSYTTLANALSGMTSGTVYLFGDVDVDASLAIPAGVTVNASGKTLTVGNGADLAVNGVVDLTDGGSIAIDPAADKDAKKGTVTVNNYIVGTNLTTYSAMIPGFYAAGAIGETEGDFIMSAAVAQDNAAELGNLAVYGPITTGDLSFANAEETAKTITVNGTYTSGTITIDGYNVIFAAGATYNGTIANAEGSVALANINGIIVSDATVEDADRLTVTGTPDKITGTDGKDLKSAIVFAGTVYVGQMDLTNLGDMTAPAGATVNMAGTVTNVNNLTVEGTMGVLSGADVTAKVLNVTGTVTVAAEADGNAAGVLKVDSVYAGITKDDVDNGKAVAATSASIDGTVTIQNNGYAYVAPGATLSEGFTEGMNSAEFSVEGAVWFTVYSDSEAVGVTKAPINDGYFLGWATEQDGDVVYDADSDVDWTDIPLNADGVTYYSVGDYDIYTVTVVADDGVGAIYIGGVVLQKTGNTFVTMFPMTAGVKEISVVAKSGFNADNVEITGTGVSGNNLTLSGTTNTGIVLYVTGTEAVTGQGTVVTVSGDDGMGLTDYLLIILVVLVVVMAILVATRLMRS